MSIMRKGEAMRETKKLGRTLESGQEKDAVFCWRAMVFSQRSGNDQSCTSTWLQDRLDIG